MILNLDDGYDKSEGTNLPMFSRTGKFTISMYMVFNQKKRSVDPSPRPQDHLEDEDIGLLLGTKNISI